VYGKRSESIRLVLGALGMNILRCWVPYPFRVFSFMPPNVYRIARTLPVLFQN
jgi:hypothetical protein